MGDLVITDSLRTFHETVYAIGIGSEGAISLEYMKEKGIQGVDYVIPDENLTARDLALYRLIFLVGGKGDLPPAEMARSIADKPKGNDCSTIGIVAVPFLAEGAQSAYPFSDELESFKKEVDLLIVVSNDDRLRPDTGNSFIDCQEITHHQIWLAAKTIMDVATYKGVVCVDMDDVRYVAKNGGYGFMTMGQASGENRVEKAVRMAMPATSLFTNQTGNAGHLLIYIYYGPVGITMREIGEILDLFQKAINPESDIIWNCGYDPTLQDDLRISVIWTGLEKPPIIPVSIMKSIYF
jgi:cell division protein FtsZ